MNRQTVNNLATYLAKKDGRDIPSVKDGRLAKNTLFGFMYGRSTMGVMYEDQRRWKGLGKDFHSNPGNPHHPIHGNEYHISIPVEDANAMIILEDSYKASFMSGMAFTTAVRIGIRIYLTPGYELTPTEFSFIFVAGVLLLLSVHLYMEARNAVHRHSRLMGNDRINLRHSSIGGFSGQVEEEEK